MKCCRKCKEKKLLSEFSLNTARKDKLHSYCKICSRSIVSSWHKNNPEKSKASGLRYRLNNPDRIKEKRAEWGRKNPRHTELYLRTAVGRFRALKHAMKTKGGNITQSQHWTLIEPNVCYYCGKHLHETGSGLDRIDSAKGYDFDNVRACCKHCNKAKSNLTEYDFIKLVNAIYNNLVEKSEEVL
jgi:hypothetical protein